MKVQPNRIGMSLVAILLVLACMIKSEATFHLMYFDAENPTIPATVLIDQRPVFQVKNTPFKFEEYSTRLRPGLHTFALRQGNNVHTARFLYLHFNSNIVEFSSQELGGGYTWYVTPHVGEFLPD
ncbi:hypothetical protein ACFST9_17955 [Hymenobacter monticola]|uniref:DUF4397 domain-containing protein n=1 Tax=Hymenobacter monticola TaxID=1705399 RepID=A0ABY4AZ78_9BACT|nr:hypothetical protein [Hymenobacter monticola]UOE32208.1 hypothetical protein MTP16_13820 [Hymenobacter monticola]